MHNNILKRLKRCAAITGALLLVGCAGPKQMTKDKTTGTTTGPVDTTTAVTSPVLPAKDFRGVWMATVGNIDWPDRYTSSAAEIERQKQYYERCLDTLQVHHINAVLFQVRPMADAFYASPYEPWTKYLSGERGRDPGWDPLPWLISQTHKRGMQFHAWINPYRIAARKSRTQKYPALESTIPAAWTKTYRFVRIYNPALPEVRQRIADIVADLLRRYNVDGIHFDDYFYPALERGELMNDKAEYRRYGHGMSLDDFRRANVDSMILKVRQTIQSVRPNCLFSVSPQGNYDNDYRVMYCDVKKWSRNGWVDVLIPQLYWSTERYFTPRLKQFADLSEDSKLMVGYGLYRFGEKAASSYYRSNADLQAQFDTAYANPKVKGSVLYSERWMMTNPVNLNAVIAKQFDRLTLPPYLGHQPMVRPAAPQQVQADGLRLSWDAVPNCYYAVYQSHGHGKEATLVSITYDTSAQVPAAGDYFVTALTLGLNAESEVSAIVRCSPTPVR